MSNFFVRISDSTYNQKAGSPLKKVDLKALLQASFDLLKDDKQKGKHGQIFTYDNNVLGKEYWPNGKTTNKNVAFFDLDWITKECADNIFNNFERLCDTFPSLLAIQYSSSYFIDGPKNGLHVYVNTRELDNFEYYNECRLIYMTLLQSIHKVTGYDLRIPQIDGNTIVDTHNMEMTQRINLYWSPFKWNDNSLMFVEEMISSSLGKLEDKYGQLFEKRKQFKPTIIEDISGCYEINDIETPKLLVDKHLDVAGFNGNDLRWRISSIGNILFGEEESKKWCDRYFYCDKGSIWQGGKYGTNHRILNWLIDKGYISSSTKTEYCEDGDGIEVKTFLKEEQYEFIKNEIESNKVLTIQGDPGIGKTVCIGNLAKEMKGIVITPYNVMRRLYERAGLTIIDDKNRDSFDFENNGCVCVYDQFSIIYERIQGKTVFIDESHILFKDREYRERLIKVLDVLKEWAGKIVIISATPLREASLLGNEKTLKFWKRRPVINGIFKIVDNLNKMKVLENKIVTTNINNEKYTHICVFGNRGTRMIYDNLTLRYGREIHNKVNIFHRDYEALGDIARVQESEILDKKINLGTSLVFNGVNFKNEGASILVVIEYEEGISGWWDIVQAMTRVRKSNVTLYVIASKEQEEKISLDDKIEDAKKLDLIGIKDSLIRYSRKYVDIEDTIRELDEFRKEECSIEYCLSQLKTINWLSINVNDEEIDTEKVEKNLLRSRIDGIIKKELNGEKIDEMEIEIKKDGVEYYDATMESIENVCNVYGITPNEVISLNNSEKIDTKNNCKTVTIGTTLEHIRYTVDACVDDDGYWTAMDGLIDKMYDGSVMHKIRKDCISRIIETRKKYRGYFENFMLANTNGYGDVIGMINEMIEHNNESNKDKQAKRAEAGKKRIKDLETGAIYDSCSECAESIGHNATYISKHKERFIKI